MRILIVEDVRLVAWDISRMVEEIGHKVVGMAHTPEEALQAIKDKNPELVLLDIDLKSKASGIDVAEAIYKDYHIPFIFLTAFADELTLARAKLSHPAGYLVKPVSEKEIRAAIEIAAYNFQSSASTETDYHLDRGHHDVLHEENEDHLFVRHKGQLQKVEIADILWVEAMDTYSRIHTTKDKITVPMTLKSMEERLAHSSMIRAHKSYLINLSRIESIRDNHLLIGGGRIPIGKSYKPRLMKQLNLL